MKKIYIAVLVMIMIMISCQVSFAETTTSEEMSCKDACKIIVGAELTEGECEILDSGNPVCKILDEGEDAVCKWCCESELHLLSCIALTVAILAE